MILINFINLIFSRGFFHQPRDKRYLNHGIQNEPKQLACNNLDCPASNFTCGDDMAF